MCFPPVSKITGFQHKKINEVNQECNESNRDTCYWASILYSVNDTIRINGNVYERNSRYEDLIFFNGLVAKQKGNTLQKFERGCNSHQVLHLTNLIFKYIIKT